MYSWTILCMTTSLNSQTPMITTDVLTFCNIKLYILCKDAFVTCTEMAVYMCVHMLQPNSSLPLAPCSWDSFFFLCVLCLQFSFQFSLYFCLLQCLVQCSFCISVPFSACFNALFIAHFLVLFFDLACKVPLCFFTLICTLQYPSPWFCYVHTDFANLFAIQTVLICGFITSLIVTLK